MTPPAGTFWQYLWHHLSTNTMAKKKHSAWLQKEGYQERGRCTKPMKDETIQKRWRRHVGRQKGSATGGDAVTGTVRYGRPKDSPDLRAIGAA